MIVSSQMYVRKVKFVGPATDLLAARRKMNTVLDEDLLRTAGLPTSAILCVRSLRDPKPGSFHLRSADPRVMSEWQRAFVTSIQHLAHHAAHPIDGPVPANAQAVIFRERAELLACLAADWCAGDLATHWWWNSLRGGSDITEWVMKTWLETPEYIPAVLLHLEVKGQSVSFIQKLSDKDVSQMLYTLVHTFGLQTLAFAIDQHQDSASRRSLIPNDLIPHRGRVDANPRVNAAPPWRHWMQTSALDQLSPTRQLLLAVGLMLERAPSTVRTAAFARQVMEWIETVDGSPPKEQALASPLSVRQVDRFYASSIGVNEEVDNVDSSVKVDEISMSQVPSSPTLPQTVQSPEESERPAGTDYAPDPPAEISSDETSTEIPEIEIRSRFGAVFYFVELGLYLELYSDFTRPLEPGIELPIWDFLALVAQEIIGAEVMEDPVWSLLARLAGRPEDEPPGLEFEPPGYPSFEAWRSELMLTIRARLQSALGDEDGNLGRFFRQAAHIVVTATRLDVYFALAALPIEIRFSGLDRDPGWVPAAGKFIGFHYE